VKSARHAGCGGALRSTGDDCAVCGKCGCPVLRSIPPPPTLAIRVVHAGAPPRLPPALLAPAAPPLLLPAHEEAEDGDQPSPASGVDALARAESAADVARVLRALREPSAEELGAARARVRHLQGVVADEACALGALAHELGSVPRRGNIEGAREGVALLEHDALPADGAPDLGAWPW
jgi:hypothetical protein